MSVIGRSPQKILAWVVSLGLAATIGVWFRFFREPSFLLRLDIEKGSVGYRVHRVWKSSPGEVGNGNQTHDFYLEVRKDTNLANPGKNLHLTVVNFEGKSDSDESSTDHRLAQLNQKALQYLLPISPQGPTSPLDFYESNAEGWAGMMIGKACGMYEVGPVELHYPEDPVKVGDSWTAEVFVGDEATAQFEKQGRPNATCTYRLASVSSDSREGILTFSLDAKIDGTYPDLFSNKTKTYTRRVTSSGSWTIDLRSGFGKSFEARREMTTTWDPPSGQKPQGEITTTSAKE